MRSRAPNDLAAATLFLRALFPRKKKCVAARSFSARLRISPPWSPVGTATQRARRRANRRKTEMQIYRLETDEEYRLVSPRLNDCAGVHRGTDQVQMRAEHHPRREEAFKIRETCGCVWHGQSQNRTGKGCREASCSPRTAGTGNRSRIANFGKMNPRRIGRQCGADEVPAIATTYILKCEAAAVQPLSGYWWHRLSESSEVLDVGMIDGALPSTPVMNIANSVDAIRRK